MQLRELALDRNKIRQLDPLALRGLANLRELRLEENGLRALDGLAPLPKLQVRARDRAGTRARARATCVESSSRAARAARSSRIAFAAGSA